MLIALSSNAGWAVIFMCDDVYVSLFSLYMEKATRV